MNIASGIVLIIAIVGAVDFLTNLVKAGDPVARNADIKVALAFLGSLGVLLLAAQTSVAGHIDLSGILPVDPGSTVKSLGFADVCFASLIIAFNASILASFRKAIDSTQTAAQPSLTSDTHA